MILGASVLGVNSITVVLVGSVGSGTRPHSSILHICYLMSFEISLILTIISFYILMELFSSVLTFFYFFCCVILYKSHIGQFYKSVSKAADRTFYRLNSLQTQKIKMIRMKSTMARVPHYLLIQESHVVVIITTS